MFKLNLTQTGSRILFLIGQVIVLLICLIIIHHSYLNNINPDKQAKVSFLKTPCFLVSKKLNVRGPIVHAYRADFLINYTVKGVQYSRWVSGNGLDASFFRNMHDQEVVLMQYEVGQSYTCYYDPQDPQVALLVWRQNWVSLFPLMAPVVITILFAYFFWKTSLPLLKKVKRKRKQKR